MLLKNKGLMKKILFCLLILLSPAICFADGHLTEDQKKKTIECAGIYYANSMIPQAELELDKIVHSFAAKKFLSSYLVKEGVNEDNLNNELIKIVDVRYGKPYEENTTKESEPNFEPYSIFQSEQLIIIHLSIYL